MKKKHRNEKKRKHDARKSRIGTRIARSERHRLTVFRSAKHIYAQISDGDSGRTLITVSSRTKDVVGDGYTGNIDAAKEVGKAVAEKAREKQIEHVVFNRNGFLFHGRVKALAEAAREAGLQF